MSWSYKANWNGIKDGTREVTSEHFEDIRRLCFAIAQVSRTQDLHGYYVEPHTDNINEFDTYENDELYGKGSIVVYRNRPYLLRQGWSQGIRPPEGSWVLIARSNVFTDYDYNSGCKGYISKDDAYYTFPSWYALPPQVDRFRRRTGATKDGTVIGYQRFIEWLTETGSPLAGKAQRWQDELVDTLMRINANTAEYEQLQAERELIVKQGGDTTVIDNTIAKNREDYEMLLEILHNVRELIKSINPEHVGNDNPVEFAIKEADAFQEAGGGGRFNMDIVSGALGAQYEEYSYAKENLNAQEIPIGRSVYPYTKAHKQPFLQSDSGFDWKIQAYQSYIESFVDARGDFKYPSPAWSDGDNTFYFRRLDDRDVTWEGLKALPQVWNCNFSAFEKCLDLVGEYDWYLDVAFPPDPTMEKLDTYGEERRIKGVWRRTWKYSIGYPRCPFTWVFDPKTERPLIYPGEKGTPPYQNIPANPARAEGLDPFWTIKDNVIKAWFEAAGRLTDSERRVTNNRHDFTSLDKEQPYYEQQIHRAQGHENGTYINYEPRLGHILWTAKEVLEKLIYLPLEYVSFGYFLVQGGSGTNPETGNSWEDDGLTAPTSAGGALSVALANYNKMWDNRFISRSAAPENFQNAFSVVQEEYTHPTFFGANPPAIPVASASVIDYIPYFRITGLSESLLNIIDQVSDYGVAVLIRYVPSQLSPGTFEDTTTPVTTPYFKDAERRNIVNFRHPPIPAGIGEYEYNLTQPATGATYTTEVLYIGLPNVSKKENEGEFGDETAVYLEGIKTSGGSQLLEFGTRKKHIVIDDEGDLYWTDLSIRWQDSVQGRAVFENDSTAAHIKINVQKLNLNEGLL